MNVKVLNKGEGCIKIKEKRVKDDKDETEEVQV